MIDFDFSKNRKDYFEKENYLSLDNGYPERNVDWFKSKIMPHLQNVLVNINSSNNNFLDVGCAGGYFTKLMSTLFFDTLGIDFCESRISHAKKSETDHLKFMQVDILDEEIDKKIKDRYDVAFTQAVIQHIHSSRQISAMSNISKLLKRDGYFLIYDAIDHETNDNHFVHRPTIQWYKNLKDYTFISCEKLEDDDELWVIILKKN